MHRLYRPPKSIGLLERVDPLDTNKYIFAQDNSAELAKAGPGPGEAGWRWATPPAGGLR